MKTPTQSVLDKAKEIIHGDREKTYGHPSANLSRIADYWSVYLADRVGCVKRITPEDVCWMMTLLKMSRQMNAHSDDNLVDAIGYIALIERIEQP